MFVKFYQFDSITFAREPHKNVGLVLHTKHSEFVCSAHADILSDRGLDVHGYTHAMSLDRRSLHSWYFSEERHRLGTQMLQTPARLAIVRSCARLVVVGGWQSTVARSSKYHGNNILANTHA